MFLSIYRQRRRILAGTIAAVFMLVLGVEHAIPEFFEGSAQVWAGTLVIMAMIFAVCVTGLVLLLPRLRHVIEIGAFAGLLDVSARRFLPELFASFDNFIFGDLFVVVVFIATMLFFYGELSDALSTEFSYNGRARLSTSSTPDEVASAITELGWTDQVRLNAQSHSGTRVTLTDTRPALRLPDAMRSWFDDAAGLRADALRAHLAR